MVSIEWLPSVISIVNGFLKNLMESQSLNGFPLNGFSIIKWFSIKWNLKSLNGFSIIKWIQLNGFSIIKWIKLNCFSIKKWKTICFSKYGFHYMVFIKWFLNH